ncbi:ATP-binding protein [Shouchella lehensis]|uniref:Helicase HerA central domain-containing protein n=1 Tax=Shouchella lehensis G1 TaxID=1246626 RepID=A0A060LRC3_9BACI|nr:ATP-binding protein [Shouchella lehensis]AIC92712.1 hypothetical protein BleG1_0097 [Shouchella lehensis G1]
MKNSIGVVSKVFFNKIVIEVPDTNKTSYNYKGDLYTFNGINSYLTINKSHTEKYIYQVISLYEQEKPFNLEEISKFSGKAYVEAIPIGEIYKGSFEYGLSKFPIIGSGVFLTSYDDINNILSKKSNEEVTISLGTLANQNNYIPKLSVNDLLSHHMSILGNTGSGKSTTIRKIFNELLELKNREDLHVNDMNFLIFDVHDEYDNFPNSYMELINMNEISIPLETLTIDDWITLVQPSSAVQLPVLLSGLNLASLLNTDKVSIKSLKSFYAIEMYHSVQTEVVGKRTKIINLIKDLDIRNINNHIKNYTSFGNFKGNGEEEFLDDLKLFFEEESECEYKNFSKKLEKLAEQDTCVIKNLKDLKIGIELVLLSEEVKGNSQIRSYCSTLMTRIDSLLAVYSKGLFDSDQKKLSNFKKILEMSKALTVLKCSSIEDDDLLFIASYLLRVTFINQKKHKQQGNNVKSIYHFVFDEAHKYINDYSKMVNNSTNKMFEQIAKEGRKFGVFMVIASQRPSELSKTVLSQCNNFILHRIRNDIDTDQIRRSIPYITESQIMRLSYLRSGSVLLVGEAYSVPMELMIDGHKLGEVSKTQLPTDIWAAGKKEPYNY